MDKEHMEKEFENHIQKAFNLTDEQMDFIKTHKTVSIHNCLKKRTNIIENRIRNNMNKFIEKCMVE